MAWYVRCAARLLGAVLFLFGLPAAAEDRVLIMTISDYPGQALEGVKHDANNGFALAKKLGYETSGAVRLRDKALTLSDMNNALRNLVQQTQSGDRVFIYFSGHGGSSKRNNVCEQSIMAQDAQPLYSGELASYLEQLKDVASKVTVVLDSCHSGGVLSDVERVRSGAKGAVSSQIKAKSWVPKDGENCSNAVNYVTTAIPAMRSAKGVTDLSKNYVYITAARDNEYALDNPDSGGLASTSLINCLDKGVVSTDNSGVISVGDLAQCAQVQVDQGVVAINAAAGSGERAKWLPPHVTIAGNKNAPILGSQTAASTNTGGAGGNVVSPGSPSAVPVNAVNALRRINDGQDARWGYVARPSLTEGKIGSAFTIDYQTNRPGYLYILYAGSDGKEFLQLYPSGGAHRYHGMTNGRLLKADGTPVSYQLLDPPGDNHLLVVITERPRDWSSVFKNGTANATMESAQAILCAAEGKTRNIASDDGPGCVQTSQISASSEGVKGSDVQGFGGYGATLLTVKGL